MFGYGNIWKIPLLVLVPSNEIKFSLLLRVTDNRTYYEVLAFNNSNPFFNGKKSIQVPKIYWYAVQEHARLGNMGYVIIVAFQIK